MNRRQFVATTSTAALLPFVGWAAIAKEDFGIWDSHTHLGRNNEPSKNHAEELLRVANRMGVEKITIAMGRAPHLQNPKPSELREKNDDMMAALDAFPKETLGLVYVNPLHVEESLTEIERCRSHPQVIGLKLWIACRCNDHRLDPIVRLAANHQMTIHQHVWDKTTPMAEGESLPEDLATLATRHPQTQFIAMHSGGNWERGLRALRRAPNVFAELSGSEPVSGFVEMAVRELGDERVIWGSDANGRGFASQLAKVHGAQISSVARRRILRDNFRQQAERALAAK
jgi:predicted TIM-barrel fold metal-dependent hydrolase